MQHRVLENYQVCLNGEPRFTFDNFMPSSNLVPLTFIGGNVPGTMSDFSETLDASLLYKSWCIVN